MQSKIKSSLNFARFLSLALFALAMVMPVASMAEEASSANTPPSKMDPIRQRLFQNTVGCNFSTLTQDKILDIVYDIAMHGDLTDVAFTEKKLQTKLERSTLLLPIRDSNPYSRSYTAEFMFKTMINAGYRVSFNPAEFEKGKESPVKKEGNLYIQNLNHPDFDFRGCGYITKKQVNRKFGGGFTERINKAEKHAGACKELGNVGSTPITIIYNFNPDTNAVNSIVINQQVPSTYSFKCNRSNP